MADDVLDRLVEAVVYGTLPSSSIVSKYRQIASDPTHFNAAQLKAIPKVITLGVFCVFSVVYLKEELKWNYIAGFAMMFGAVFVIFKEW